MTTFYDPPAGWLYGFPKPYAPREGETLADTLLRDGYPQREIDNGGATHVRFIGEDARATARAALGPGAFRDAGRDWQGDYAALLAAARYVVEAWPQGGPRLVDAVRDLSVFLEAEDESRRVDPEDESDERDDNES